MSDVGYSGWSLTDPGEGCLLFWTEFDWPGGVMSVILDGVWLTWMSDVGYSGWSLTDLDEWCLLFLMEFDWPGWVMSLILDGVWLTRMSDVGYSGWSLTDLDEWCRLFWMEFDWPGWVMSVILDGVPPSVHSQFGSPSSSPLLLPSSSVSARQKSAVHLCLKISFLFPLKIINIIRKIL